MAEYNVDVLTDEAMKLLEFETDRLYAILGAQLLGQTLPTRSAGIVTYLSAVKQGFEAKDFLETIVSEKALREWAKGLGVVFEELKRDGIQHFTNMVPELRKALCNDEIIKLADTVIRSNVQIIVMIVGAALRTSRELDPVSATVTALLFNLGLRNFCAEGKE